MWKIKLNLCCFCVSVPVRLLIGLLVHVTWLLSLQVNCQYFIFWKSYDLFWYWSHAVLSVFIVKLRPLNYFVVGVWLCARRCTTNKTCQEIYEREIAPTEQAFQKDAATAGVDDSGVVAVSRRNEEEGEEEEGGGVSTKVKVVVVRNDMSAPPPNNNSPFEEPALCCQCGLSNKSSKVANAVDLALYLYRLRVSLAILAGNILKSVIEAIDGSGGEGGGGELAVSFRLTLWLDVVLLWLSLLVAYCRQCWLCCSLGCKRFWLWLISLIIIGLLLMELPMQYVQLRLADNWCTFVKQ